MAVHELGPDFLEVKYHSVYGKHKQRFQTVPTELVIGTPTGTLADYNFILRGAALPISCEAAVADYLNIMKNLLPFNASIDQVTLYKLGEDAPIPRPVARNNYTIAGTMNDSAAILDKATQLTFSFSTQAFNPFRMVFLDVQIEAIAKYPTATGFAPGVALVEYVTDPVSFISGRDNERPVGLTGLSNDINDRLQRAYNR